MPRRARWKEDLDDWVRSLQSEGKSRKTVKEYRNGLRRTYTWGEANGWPANPRKLQPENIYAYYDHVQRYRSKTQALYMTILMEFVRHLRCPNVSHMKLRVRPERGEVHWLERSEVIRLFQTAPTPRCLAAEVVFAFTGIREMELRELRVQDVTDEWLIINAGKGRKARKIPIDREFWTMLRPYLEWRKKYTKTWPDSPFFLVHPEHASCERGSLIPYSASGISDMLKRHGLSQGIEHANSHPWRRFFGRDLYENDCPVSQIQRYYGHSSEKQTLDYIGITQEMDVRAMKRYRRSFLEEM